jgi:hypothetical protein
MMLLLRVRFKCRMEMQRVLFVCNKMLEGGGRKERERGQMVTCDTSLEKFESSVGVRECNFLQTVFLFNSQKYLPLKWL